MATLNEKYEVSESKIKFLGQAIEASRVSADPNKLNAVKAMREPSNMSEVRGLLGMINHLDNFLPDLAKKSCPLGDLLKQLNIWAWGPNSRKLLIELKRY